MKILIVEDEENLRRLYKEEFEDEGHEVIVAETGEEGVGLFERKKPDVVTLDVCLSCIDEGIHVLRRMKKLCPTVPIIIHSAFDYTDDFEVWDADAYITKSTDLSALKAAIREAGEPVDA
jgi:DNA-binding response OmpR family regulator